MGNSFVKFEDIDFTEIQEFYDKNHTIRDCKDKFKITFARLAKAAKMGILKTRTKAETMKIRGTDGKGRIVSQIT